MSAAGTEYKTLAHSYYLIDRHKLAGTTQQKMHNTKTSDHPITGIITCTWSLALRF